MTLSGISRVWREVLPAVVRQLQKHWKKNKKKRKDTKNENEHGQNDKTQQFVGLSQLPSFPPPPLPAPYCVTFLQRTQGQAPAPFSRKRYQRKYHINHNHTHEARAQTQDDSVVLRVVRVPPFTYSTTDKSPTVNRNSDSGSDSSSYSGRTSYKDSKMLSAVLERIATANYNAGTDTSGTTECGVDVFLTTQYSYPYNDQQKQRQQQNQLLGQVSSPANILLIHDLIPEALGWNMQSPEWSSKQAAIARAHAIVSVSEATRHAFLTHYGGSTGNGTGERTHHGGDMRAVNITVAPNGVRCDVFFPRPEQEILAFRMQFLSKNHSSSSSSSSSSSGGGEATVVDEAKCRSSDCPYIVGENEPYIVVVGRRGGYKNIWLLYRLLQRWNSYSTASVAAAQTINNNHPFLLLVGPALEPWEVEILLGVRYRLLQDLPDAELAKAYSGAAALMYVFFVDYYAKQFECFVPTS